jgi:WD40 repeat protein
VLKMMFFAKCKIAAPVCLVGLSLALSLGHHLLSALGASESTGQGAVVAPVSMPRKGAGRGAAWPRDAGRPQVLVKCKSPVTSLAWSADGHLLAAGTEDGTVHVTQVSTGKDRSFPTQDSAVTALAFSPDGRALELFNKLFRESTWDAGTGEQFGGHFQSDAVCAVDHLAFMPGGRWVVGIGGGCFSKRQFVTSGPAEGRTRAGSAREQGCTAVAPDGAVAGRCNSRGLLVLFKSGPADRIDFDEDSDRALEIGKARSIALGPGGKLLAVAGEEAVALWDLPEGKKKHALPGMDRSANRVTMSANGETLVGLFRDEKSMLAWDLTRNSPRCRVNSHATVGALALSPDGTALATTAKEGKEVFLWKLER